MKVDEYSEVVRVVFPIVKHKFLNEFYSRFVIFSLSFHFRLIRIRCGHCYKHFLAAQLLNLALHATFLINFLWICVHEIKKTDRFFWKILKTNEEIHISINQISCSYLRANAWFSFDFTAFSDLFFIETLTKIKMFLQWIGIHSIQL